MHVMQPATVRGISRQAERNASIIRGFMARCLLFVFATALPLAAAQNCACASDAAVPKSDQLTCRSTGDPHYTTFRGKSHDFMGTGMYQLAKSSGTCDCSTHDDIDIQTYMCEAHKKGASANTVVAAKVAGVTFVISGYDDCVLVTGSTEADNGVSERCSSETALGGAAPGYSETFGTNGDQFRDTDGATITLKREARLRPCPRPRAPHNAPDSPPPCFAEHQRSDGLAHRVSRRRQPPLPTLRFQWFSARSHVGNGARGGGVGRGWQEIGLPSTVPDAAE